MSSLRWILVGLYRGVCGVDCRGKCSLWFSSKRLLLTFVLPLILVNACAALYETSDKKVPRHFEVADDGVANRQNHKLRWRSDRRVGHSPTFESRFLTARMIFRLTTEVTIFDGLISLWINSAQPSSRCYGRSRRAYFIGNANATRKARLLSLETIRRMVALAILNPIDCRVDVTNECALMFF